MQSINLYILTRHIDNNVLSLYERSISSRESELRIRNGELDMIRDISERLLQTGMDFSCLDNWFYSFSIPQISKEFDLLKIGKNNTVINIELKEQEVDEERIQKQLIQNKYYLSIISDNVYCFTCMRTHSEEITIYELDENDLIIVTFDELKASIESIHEAEDLNIEKLFCPKNYLISPINTPERFLLNEYFLNNHQETIKNEIINGILSGKKLWGIKGGPGTGKTLLLYDIAKTLSSHHRICIIHSGILSDGHNYLASNLEHFTIIDAKHATQDLMKNYDLVCVDESQRLYSSVIDDILELVKEGSIKGCIFAYDFSQCLSKAERRRNNPERLRNTSGFIEKRLSERIRTNKIMFSFIRSMLRLTDVPRKPMQYDCIDVLYANTEQEADRILEIYIEKGYKFITLTPSQFYYNEIDHFARYDNSHQVIGQEFDNVIIILDNNFRYDENGDLEGREHPNPDYLFPKLFYQNITRVREKLCILVLNNPTIFEILLKVKNNSLTYEELKTILYIQNQKTDVL